VQNTVATLTAHISSDSQAAIGPGGGTSFVALPNPIYAAAGQSQGQTTLYFDVPGAATLQIRVGSPTGPMLIQAGASGTAVTGNWVSDGMTFYLQDVSTAVPGKTIATLVAHVLADGQDAIASSGSIAFSASPNPVPVAAGQQLGQTTFYFAVPGVSTLQIHVGSPIGPLLIQAGPMGNAITGNWVSNGMTFYLQDVSNGLPGTTVATTTVTLAPQ
jgi:hypothetical protein